MSAVFLLCCFYLVFTLKLVDQLVVSSCNQAIIRVCVCMCVRVCNGHGP